MRLLIMLATLMVSYFSYAEALIIATPPTTPPFVMTNKKLNLFYGYSIDMMDAICKRINATCHYQQFSFNDVFTEVLDRKVDAAVGHLTVTNEREQYLGFSLPYLRSEIQFLTLAASPISSPEDLQGKNVGVEESSVFQDYIKQKYNDTTKVIAYSTAADLIDALNHGKIDAAIFYKQTAEYWYASHHDFFKLLRPTASVGLGMAIMTSKINTQLISRMNQALLEMETDGTYLKIFKTYFGDIALKM